MSGCRSGPSRLPGGQGDDPDGGIGERDARLDRRPPEDGRALQAEEDQDATEEPLDAGTFAQLLGGPGWRQPVPPLLPLGIPRDDRLRASARCGSRRSA